MFVLIYTSSTLVLGSLPSYVVSLSRTVSK